MIAHSLLLFADHEIEIACALPNVIPLRAASCLTRTATFPSFVCDRPHRVRIYTKK